MSGDINNDGISGTGADIVHLISNLSSISSINDLDGDNSVTQADVTYLANAIVKKTGYTLETGSRNLNNYLLNSPPSVVFGGTYASTANEIYISWSYPTQIEAAFSELYLPFISSITIKIDVYDGSTTSTSTDNVILNAISGDKYIKYNGASAFSSSPITGLVLSKAQTAISGYKPDITFPGEQTARPCYLYKDTSLFAALQAHENSKVKIHYSNHNSTAVISEFAYPGFLESGPPSGIQGLTVTYTNTNAKAYKINLSIQAPQYSDKNNNYAHGDSNGTDFNKFTVTTLTDGICANRFVTSGDRHDTKMDNIVTRNISDISANWVFNGQYLYNYDASLVTIATPALYNETIQNSGAIPVLVLDNETGHIYTDTSVGYIGGNFNTVSLDIDYKTGEQDGIRPESNYWFNVMVENNATSTLGDSVWCGPYLTPPLAGPLMTTSGFYKGTGQTLSVTFKNGDTTVNPVTVRLASDSSQKSNVIPTAITKVTFSDSNIPIQNQTSRGTLSLNAYRLVRVQTKLTGGSATFDEDNRMHIRGFINGSEGNDTETDIPGSLSSSSGDYNYSKSLFIVPGVPTYTDFHNGDDTHKKGYYNLANISYTIGPRSNNASNMWTNNTQPSNTLYTITQTINQYNSDTDNTVTGTKTSSTTFYYDSGLTITPTIEGVSQTITSYGTAKTICGVTTTNGNVTLSATVSNVTNLGNYFYNKDQVISYDDESTTTHTTPTITDGVVETSTFTKSGLLKNPGSGVQTSVGLEVTAYGPTDLTHVVVATTHPIRHDGEGHPSDYPGQMGNANTSVNTGFRIKSGTPRGGTGDTFLQLVPEYEAGAVPDTFDDDAELNDITAELIVYDGRFRTVGSNSVKEQNGYKNWGDDGLQSVSTYSAGSPNYFSLTGVAVNSKYYRFASFAWQFPQSNSTTTFAKFIFNIKGVSGTVAISGTDPDTLTVDGEDLHIFYKTTSSSDSNYPGSSSQSNVNGAWISATRYGEADGDFLNITAATYKEATSKVVGGRLSSTNSVSGSGSDKTISVTGAYKGSTTLKEAYDDGTIVIMRIIVPYDVDFSFTHVTLQCSA